MEISDDRTLVSSSERSSDGYQAIVGGQLTVMAGGCVGLTAGGVDHATIFPAGTTFTENGLFIPDGGEVLFGDVLSFSGGWVTYDDRYEGILPDDCVSDEVIVVTDSAR